MGGGYMDVTADHSGKSYLKGWRVKKKGGGGEEQKQWRRQLLGDSGCDRGTARGNSGVPEGF
jgi:hypothetical protein